MRRRSRGCALAAVLVLVGVAAGCSALSGGDENEPAGAATSELQSEAAGDDAAVPAAEDEADAQLEQAPLFTTYHPEALNPSGRQFAMWDVTSDGQGLITLVGDHVDFDERRQTARVVMVPDSGDHEVIDLPSGAPVSGAYDVEYRPDGSLVVAGWENLDGVRRPAIWEQTGDEFPAVELPGGERGEVYVLSAAGSAAIGVFETDEGTVSVVWVENGGEWSAVEIEAPPGSEEAVLRGIAEMGSGGDLIVVGRGFTPGSGDHVTGFWEIDRDTLTPTWRVPPGIDDGVVLSGVSTTSDGGLVVVGGTSFEEGDPLVYRIDDYEPGTDAGWSSVAVTVDTADRFGTEGEGLGGVDADGDRLVTWTWSAYTRHVLESTDGGRTWSQLGYLADQNRAGQQVTGATVTADRVVLGHGLSMQAWVDGSWRRFSGQWSERSDWTVSTTRIGAGDTDIVLATMVQRPTTDPGIEQMQVWTSTDGREWTDMEVRAAGGRSRMVMTRSGPSAWLFTVGTTFGRDPLNVWSASEGQWLAENHPAADPFVRSLPLVATDTGDGGAVVATFDFNPEQAELVPKVVAPDGSLTTGSFGVARAESFDAWVGCLARVGDRFVAVLVADDEPDILLTSSDGLAWTAVAEGLASQPVSGCHEVDGELLAVVGGRDDEQLVPLSTDGVVGEPVAMPDDARVREVLDIDGRRVAFGWARGDVDVAALWWDTADGWNRLPVDEAGLGSDAFGGSSEVFEVYLTDEEIVLLGDDQIGPVVWTADRAEFVARLDRESDG